MAAVIQGRRCLYEGRLSSCRVSSRVAASGSVFRREMKWRRVQQARERAGDEKSRAERSEGNEEQQQRRTLLLLLLPYKHGCFGCCFCCCCSCQTLTTNGCCCCHYRPTALTLSLLLNYGVKGNENRLLIFAGNYLPAGQRVNWARNAPGERQVPSLDSETLKWFVEHLPILYGSCTVVVEEQGADANRQQKFD